MAKEREQIGPIDDGSLHTFEVKMCTWRSPLLELALQVVAAVVSVCMVNSTTVSVEQPQFRF